MADKTPKTATGLEPNIEAALTYVLGWVTGLVFLLLEKDNKQIRFHAMQSLVTFGLIHLFYLVLAIVFVPILFFVGPLAALLGIIMPLVGIGSFILWLVLIVKAYQGEEFVVPVLGDIAKKQLNK